MFNKLWNVKLTRFLAVGVFNTLFDLVMLNSFVFIWHIPYLIANIVSASISICSSYFLNQRIVFRSSEDHSLKRFIHFFTVTGVGILGLQTMIIYLVTHILSHHGAFVTDLLRTINLSSLSVRVFDLNVGKILAILVALSWNFAIYHYVIFKKP